MRDEVWDKYYPALTGQIKRAGHMLVRRAR